MDEIKIPFWKERGFVIGSIPVAGTIISTFFDYTFLTNYDVPAMYAEINFIATGYISLVLLACTVLFISIIALSIEIQSSKNLIPKLLFRPTGLMACMLLWTLAELSNNNSKLLIYAIYIFFIIAPMLEAYFEKSNENSYSQRLHKLLDSELSTKSASNRESSKLMDTIGYFILGALGLMILTSACQNIAKNLDLWTLSNDPSTIVIKRSNQVYIFKKYDPKTMVLDSGFSIKQLGEEGITLIPFKKNGELLTNAEHKYRKKKKEEQLRGQAEIKQKIQRILSKM